MSYHFCDGSGETPVPCKGCDKAKPGECEAWDAMKKAATALSESRHAWGGDIGITHCTDRRPSDASAATLVAEERIAALGDLVRTLKDRLDAHDDHLDAVHVNLEDHGFTLESFDSRLCSIEDALTADGHELQLGQRKAREAACSPAEGNQKGQVPSVPIMDTPANQMINIGNEFDLLPIREGILAMLEERDGVLNFEVITERFGTDPAVLAMIKEVMLALIGEGEVFEAPKGCFRMVDSPSILTSARIQEHPPKAAASRGDSVEPVQVREWVLAKLEERGDNGMLKFEEITASFGTDPAMLAMIKDVMTALGRNGQVFSPAGGCYMNP